MVKNVAAYDGSFGTLEVITQVTFRYPLPEASETVVLTREAKRIFGASLALKVGDIFS